MEGPGALHEPVEYPVSDGMPMAETDDHFEAMAIFAVGLLKDHFKGTPGVYVAGNNFLYYEQGNPKTVVSPDTYVVKGVEARNRDTFKVWEEGGHLPCFVLEITSKSTRRNDLGGKMSRYRDDLRVPEYFLFDPHGDWIPERVRGFTLVAPGVYSPVEPNAQGRLPSAELGLELAVQDERLRFFLPGADEPLLIPTEARDRYLQLAAEERQKAAEARQARESAEAEVARLRAEIDRLRGAE